MTDQEQKPSLEDLQRKMRKAGSLQVFNAAGEEVDANPPAEPAITPEEAQEEDERLQRQADMWFMQNQGVLNNPVTEETDQDEIEVEVSRDGTLIKEKEPKKEKETKEVIKEKMGPVESIVLKQALKRRHDVLRKESNAFESLPASLHKTESIDAVWKAYEEELRELRKQQLELEPSLDALTDTSQRAIKDDIEKVVHTLFELADGFQD